MHDLVVDQRKHQASAVETGATKHRANADRATGKLILEEIDEPEGPPSGCLDLGRLDRYRLAATASRCLIGIAENET